MAQANPDNSTTMPAVSSRRHFLTQAAGVAAGGAALTLATVSATSAAAVPTAAVASPDVDPIFSLIEDYRAAAKAVTAAATEVSRREEVLIEQGLGLGPFISVLDVRGPGSPQRTVVGKHEYIDRLLPADRFSKPNAAAHASLDAQIERHKAIMGESEAISWAAHDAETEALDTLIWTQPTTIAGVLALLELWPELPHIDADQANTLIISVVEALQDLHPNATVMGMKKQRPGEADWRRRHALSGWPTP